MLQEDEGPAGGVGEAWHVRPLAAGVGQPAGAGAAGGGGHTAR